ncbi:hypothetical protein PINS_up021003 [Pythium insidiosum]|nr:hypothetical protein PINS_up021003 [Pythium insidiosum]
MLPLRALRQPTTAAQLKRAAVSPCWPRSVTTLDMSGRNAGSNDRPRPLEGIRVVECGHLIAGPFAGTILSYFGAEVIKIEPPSGDQLRGWRVLDPSNTSLWWYSIGPQQEVGVDRHPQGRRTRVDPRACGVE